MSLTGENKTGLCEINSFMCISKVYGMYKIGKLHPKLYLILLYRLDSEEIHSRAEEMCDCLPPCSDTWYEPEISHAAFPGRGFNRTRTFRRILARRNVSLGVETNQYLTYVRVYNFLKSYNHCRKYDLKFKRLNHDRMTCICYAGQTLRCFTFTTRKKRECDTEQIFAME